MARAKRLLATIDAETDPFSESLRDANELPQPFMWGFWDGENYRDFTSTEKFVEFIKTKRVRAYAHNGGKFDFHYLVEYAEPQSIKVINGRIAQMTIGEAILADSYILLPVPLAAHQKTKIDYAIFEAGIRENHMEEIRSYLQDDCVYLYDFITRFQGEYPLATTLAGSALSVWRDQFGGRVDKTNQRYFESTRRYYFGGRTQAFEKGVISGNIQVWDINSAYPAAMMCDHPAGNEYDISDELPNSESKIRRSFISGSCYSQGAFPVRNDKGGVDFPVGPIEFNVTGHEYISAVKTGTIDEVVITEVRTWRETVNYAPYVKHFFKKKLEAEQKGDTTGRLFAKLFLNCLYGKMAANPQKYREWVLDEYGAWLEDDWERCNVFGSKQFFSKPLEEEKWRFYNVATAASITGWVRAFLWESICATERPLYCDTDSIICLGGSHIKIGDKLGEWSTEGSGIEMAIAGKKLYAVFDDKNKCTKQASKGVKLTGDQIKRVAKGEQVTYHSIVPTFSITRKSGYTKRDVNLT